MAFRKICYLSETISFELKSIFQTVCINNWWHIQSCDLHTLRIRGSGVATDHNIRNKILFIIQWTSWKLVFNSVCEFKIVLIFGNSSCRYNFCLLLSLSKWQFWSMEKMENTELWKRIKSLAWPWNELFSTMRNFGYKKVSCSNAAFPHISIPYFFWTVYYLFHHNTFHSLMTTNNDIWHMLHEILAWDELVKAYFILSTKDISLCTSLC